MPLSSVALESHCELGYSHIKPDACLLICWQLSNAFDSLLSEFCPELNMYERLTSVLWEDLWKIMRKMQEPGHVHSTEPVETKASVMASPHTLLTILPDYEDHTCVLVHVQNNRTQGTAAGGITHLQITLPTMQLHNPFGSSRLASRYSNPCPGSLKLFSRLEPILRTSRFLIEHTRLASSSKGQVQEKVFIIQGLES